MLVQLLKFYDEREATVISNLKYIVTCETIYQKHVHSGECFSNETVVQKFVERRAAVKKLLVEERMTVLMGRKLHLEDEKIRVYRTDIIFLWGAVKKRTKNAHLCSFLGKILEF